MPLNASLVVGTLCAFEMTSMAYLEYFRFNFEIALRAIIYLFLGIHIILSRE